MRRKKVYNPVKTDFTLTASSHTLYYYHAFRRSCYFFILLRLNCSDNI